MKKLVYILPSFVFSFPLVALAQQGDLNNLVGLVEAIGNLVSIATPIVVGIALLAFFWGLARYIFSAGDEEKKSEGRNIMIWGVIALFVMVAVFGIITFIGNALNVDIGGGINVPESPAS